MLALDPDVLAVILQWVEKAEHDLTTASYTLNCAPIARPTQSASMPSNASRSTSKRYWY